MTPDLLVELGLADAGEAARVVPLTGGVSCDVWKVETRRGTFVVKRALPRLRVAAAWHAGIERTENEVRWLKTAAAIVPGAVPEVVAEAPAEHLFALRFVADAPVWKDELAAGRIDPVFASAVGATLARIHAATAGDAVIAARFRTDTLFEQLRIEPFLRFVAAQHPAAHDRLVALADDLADQSIALVHGDISPKNILVDAGGPVFLDAECAVYGDPAFDIAFCTTHLLLKAMWLPQHAPALLDAAQTLIGGWCAGIDWEDATAALRRAGAFAPALLLARVDGKSPAPYLTDPALRAAIRERALALLSAEPRALDRLVAAWG